MSAFTTAMDGEWWDTGVLKREVHGPLIADRIAISRRSGLGQGNISSMWSKLPPDTQGYEREWLKALVQAPYGKHAFYTGKPAAAREKFIAFTGALLRNFMDARLLSVDEIADIYFENHAVEADVLFIPDFVIPGETGTRTDRIKQAVIAVLRRRLLDNKTICLYVGKSDGKPWGQSMHDEIAQFLNGGDC